jgi:hypothetical protein
MRRFDRRGRLDRQAIFLGSLLSKAAPALFGIPDPDVSNKPARIRMAAGAALGLFLSDDIQLEGLDDETDLGILAGFVFLKSELAEAVIGVGEGERIGGAFHGLELAGGSESVFDPETAVFNKKYEGSKTAAEAAEIKFIVS